MDLQGKLQSFFANRKKDVQNIVQQAPQQIASFGQNLLKTAPIINNPMGFNMAPQRPISMPQISPKPIFDTIGKIGGATADLVGHNNAFTELGQGYQGLQNYTKNYITTPAQQSHQEFSRGNAFGGLLSGLSAATGVFAPNYNVATGGISGGLRALREGRTPQEIAVAAIKGTQMPSSLSAGLGIGEKPINVAGMDVSPALAMATDVLLTRKPSAIVKDPLLFKEGKTILEKGLPGLFKNGNAKGVVPVKHGSERALAHQAEIVDVLKRYDTNPGPLMNTPHGPVAMPDIKLKSDADHLWRQIYGGNKTPPMSLDRTVGELREAFAGARTEMQMKQNGIQLGFAAKKDVKPTDEALRTSLSGRGQTIAQLKKESKQRMLGAQKEEGAFLKTVASNNKTIDNLDEFFNNMTPSLKKQRGYSNIPGADNPLIQKGKGREILRNLIGYESKLAEKGFSRAQIKTLNARTAREIFDKNISPLDTSTINAIRVKAYHDPNSLKKIIETGIDPEQEAAKAAQELAMKEHGQKVLTELDRKAVERSKQLATSNPKSLPSIIDLQKKEIPSSEPDWIKAGEIAKTQNQKGIIGDTLREQKVQEFDKFVNRSGYDVKTKVGIHDKFRTPDRVLQKIGLGKQADELRAAHDTYLKELPQEIEKITQWSKRADSKDSSRTIFQYLDGKKVNLSENDVAIANEIKPYLKQWAERLGLPEDKRVTNYITHIFDKELLQKEFDPDLAKLIRDKVAGSVYDPFTQERLGKQGYIEDVWQALDAYVKRGTRKANLDPVLKKIKDMSEGMEESQFDYVKNYIDRVNMRPTKIDLAIDNTIKQSPIGYKFGQRPVTAVTRGLRQMGYRGTLGFNVGSALRNLSQGANTYAKLGEKHTVLGFIKMLTSGKKELEEVGVLNNLITEDRTINATKKFWEKQDKRLFYFFEAAERINRGSAYFGAKSKALSEGKTEVQAIEYAKKIVRDTQFTFGSIDTPAVLQGDLNKTLLQFQSYNLKQTEFLAEMAKNKEYAGLARWALANIVFATTLGQLIGMDPLKKPDEMIPFGSVMTGQSQVGNTPAVQAVGKLKEGIFGGKDKFGNELDLADRGNKLLEAAVPLFPGGVQAKKTLEGLYSAAKGHSESASGKIQYEIPQDPITVTRAAMFGKSKLPQAKEYFDKKRSPLGQKQSEAFKSLPTDERKGYMDSVYKQRDSSKLMDEIKKGLEQGKNVDSLIKQASAAEEAPLKKTMQLKAKEDIARQRVETLGEVQTVGNKTFYNDNGSVKTLDLNPPTKGEGIDAFVNKNWNVNKALDVYKSTLPQDQKEVAYKKLNVDSSDMEYAHKASKTVDIKIQHIMSQNLSHDQLIERMTTGRVKSVAGDYFASDEVLNNLVEQDLLTKNEAKSLKALKLDKDGNSISKAKGGRIGGKSLKVDFRSLVKKNGIKPLQLRITTKSRTGKRFTPTRSITPPQIKELKFKGQPLKLKRT